jgi:hypothetical protein
MKTDCAWTLWLDFSQPGRVAQAFSIARRVQAKIIRDQ